MYLQFGKDAYRYPGSYWNNPTGYDLLNLSPEPRLTYLFNITFGHHGFFSLTPIFLVSGYGLMTAMLSKRRSAAAVITAISTLLMFVFYVGTPRGGTTADSPRVSAGCSGFIRCGCCSCRARLPGCGREVPG